MPTRRWLRSELIMLHVGRYVDFRLQTIAGPPTVTGGTLKATGLQGQPSIEACTESGQ